MAGIFKKVKLKTLALLLSKTSHRRAAGVTPSGVPPVSRPTRPAQGPSAEGPGSPSGPLMRPNGLRCASRGDQSPHVPPCPPGGAWRERLVSCTGAEGQQSFGQAFSKACSFQRRRLWSLPAGSEMLFRREPFLCFFLFAIQKERRKPPALHRGRHPGRGAAGLLVTNGGSRLELKSPTGRYQGAARAAHQKHPSGVFLRAVVAQGPSAEDPCT